MESKSLLLSESFPMKFKLLPNNGNLPPDGWRLASVDDVKNKFEEIKSQGILGKWTLSRLLDGWVAGSRLGYALQPSPTKIIPGKLIVIGLSWRDLEFELLPDYNSPIPNGWRMASVYDVSCNLNLSKSLIVFPEWSIVLLSDGCMTGSGFRSAVKKGDLITMCNMLVVQYGQFGKVHRNEHEIGEHWRLASVDEISSHLDCVKGILQPDTCARLVDGWLQPNDCGNGHDVEHGYTNKAMSEILIIYTSASRPSDGSFNPAMYEGVELSAQGREDALLLSADDSIKDVIYFVHFLYGIDLEELEKLRKQIHDMKEILGCPCHE